MIRRISFVLVGTALALATMSVSAAPQMTAQRQQPVRFLLASNGAPPVALDVGRTPVLRQRLTLDLEGVTVREALTAISDRARLVLWYTDDVIAADRRVNLRADEITVAAALTDVLVDAGVDVVFNRDGSAVIVKRLASVAVVQAGTVAGRVTDWTSREGVAGVAITVEGTRLSTTTAADGGYTIRGVPAGNRSITARRLGFVRQSQSVTVADNESTTLDFVLVRVPSVLSEVVTTATGDQRRVELGHVVGRINADSIVKASPVSSVSELLNGRVPGLQVYTYQGTVGGQVDLRLRTPTTIQLGTEPIVVVDGMRYSNIPIDLNNRVGSRAINAREPTSPLNDLNPNEIESIEIVKGPSAATLYGTDAANGVIVVTTKRGRPGPARWNAYIKGAKTGMPNIHYPDTYWGWRTIGGQPSLLASCSLEFVGRGFCSQDSVTVLRNPLNDPQLTIFGSKPRWEYGANVSGGSQGLRYFFAGDFERATGPLRMPPVLADSLARKRGIQGLGDEQLEPNSFLKMNFRSNVSAEVGRKVTVNVNAGYSDRETRTFGAGLVNTYADAFVGPVPARCVQAPIGELCTGPYGSIGTGPANKFSTVSAERVNRFFAVIGGHWTPTTWLTARGTSGIDMSSIHGSSLSRSGESILFFNGAVGEDRGRQVATTSDLGVTANYSAGRFSSRTSAGVQYVRTLDDIVSSSGSGLPPGGSSIGEATTVQTRQTFREQVTLGSYLEEMVGFNQRLFITGALRADGASTFGRDYDVAIYPKGGVSWLISQEPMLARLPGMDEVRLRYAFGAAGQQPRPEWARPGFVLQQRVFDGPLTNVYSVNSLGNPALRPERTREHEFGVDASALDRRVELALTWFRRKTSDQIVMVSLPPGLGVVQTNLGLTSGRGFEAQVTVRPFDIPALSWQIALQHSFHTTSLLDHGAASARRHPFGGWVEGYPLGARFMIPLLGYADANSDGIISTAELQRGDTAVYVGESTPPRSQVLTSVVGLFNQRLRLSALVERRSGFTQLNRLASDQCRVGRCQAGVDPATPLADQATAAALTLSDYFLIEPGDFTRFRELSIAVDIPSSVARALGMGTAALTLQGRNLALWTRYGGADPESAAVTTTGAQEYGIPQGRSWALRFDVGF